MFCNKPRNGNKSLPGKKNRKRKKKPTHPQVDNKQRKTDQSNLNIAHAMSTWAQNYTAATTWQLKHQIAYWKSRAIALQYENKILHEMVREQHFKRPPNTCNEVTSDASESDEDSENEDDDEEYDDGNVDEGDEENDNLEVSEEFIEFLKQNAKYKEEARKERERLKAKDDAENKEALAEKEKVESAEERQSRLTELYGDNWEKILALETSVLCTFISKRDKEQPEYWPNIPFNFGF